LTAAGIVAGTRRRLAKRNAFAILAVFLERAVGEALLVAQFHSRQVEHAVLHRDGDALAAARMSAVIKRGDDAEREMQPGAAVADLRAGDQRQAVAEAGGGGRAAGALRDVLVHLAIFIGAGTEALDGGDDQPRVDLSDGFPGKTHAVEHAGAEVFHQHVARRHQRGQHLLASGVLGVEGNGALVVVEHGEIQAVHIRDVLQLPAGDVTRAGTLDLDHVGAEPGQQLCTGRSRLNVREVEDANVLQRLFHDRLLHQKRRRRPSGKL